MASTQMLIIDKQHHPSSIIYTNSVCLLRIHTPKGKLSPFQNQPTMKIKFYHLFFLALFLGLTKPDPQPLQDYCVANTKAPQPVYLNGAPCMNPAFANSSHFATSALSKPGKTGRDIFGFNVTLTNLANLPGTNTLGLTMARIDISGDGLVPPHSHPRASEVTTCLRGSILVGFVDTSNRLFIQQLRVGESFVFPKGLIHFLNNLDSERPALAISGLSSQNPGAQVASVATFTSNPNMPDEILEKAFQFKGQDVINIRRRLEGRF